MAVGVAIKKAVMDSTDVDDLVLEVISENLPGLPRVDFAEVVAVGIETAFQFMRGGFVGVNPETLKAHLSAELVPEKLNLS